jgi:hypothetical protein
MIKTTFSHPNKLGNSGVWVLEALSITSLDIQQYMFKLAMRANAYVTMAKLLDVNPLTHL